MDANCTVCGTPLDDGAACVTCAARAEGLEQIYRGAYAEVRELMTLLEEQGLGAEMEKVPGTSPQERHHPKWNLYVPGPKVESARAFLGKDWAGSLGDAGAREAAARGTAGVDLDQGGEIACPACGHRFQASASQAECPDCGLSLGVPGEAAAGEEH
jgi:DNA-directed RNA polymerase subunit RPC12/RpoP